MPNPTISDELNFVRLSVLEKIAAVEAALKTQDPLLELHCENIRKSLQQHEELVHLLPDEAIHTFMAGMQKWKNVQLVKEVTSGARGRKKVSADDL